MVKYKNEEPYKSGNQKTPERVPHYVPQTKKQARNPQGIIIFLKYKIE